VHVVSATIDSSYVREWADLLVRWLHVVAGIAWIGASFYFILLDNHLEAPRNADDAAAGVMGEVWEVHGGGFYHVQKYRVAPGTLPDRLQWFKWEAYTTWLSGFALLCIVYFSDARAYLIDPSVADLTVTQAIAISLAGLVLAWVVYDFLCRALGRWPRLLALALFAFIALSAYVAGRLFAPRAMFIEVGAMIGTMMVGNVLFVIIPGHWELIRAKQAGREPDPAIGAKGKLRSVHNNYLTLPVLLTMLSNHFPFVYGHEDAWLILCAFVALGAYVRHFFNLRHAGRNVWSIPLVSAIAVLGLFIWLAPSDTAPAGPVTSTQIAAGKQVFLSAGCTGCHTLENAGATGDVGPNLDAARPSRALVLNRVTNGQGVMPSFSGKLSQQQIQDVAAYVSTVAGKS
jgi:uncharacterized membrane protein